MPAWGMMNCPTCGKSIQVGSTHLCDGPLGGVTPDAAYQLGRRFTEQLYTQQEVEKLVEDAEKRGFYAGRLVAPSPYQFPEFSDYQRSLKK